MIKNKIEVNLQNNNIIMLKKKKKKKKPEMIKLRLL